MNLLVTNFSIIFILLTVLFASALAKPDWLLHPEKYPAKVEILKEKNEIKLTNGLVTRTFRTAPNLATISLKQNITGEEFIRSVHPEAVLKIDGFEINVGGLTGQPIHNYLLPEWIAQLKAEPAAFKFTGYEIGSIQSRFQWQKRRRWMPQDLPWPPPGKMLTLHFQADAQTISTLNQQEKSAKFLSEVAVNIHYEIYDGIPLISKWLTIKNNATKPFTLESFKSEILAVVEPESQVDDATYWRFPNLLIETDYTFGGGMSATSSNSKSVFWLTDSLYKSQVNYNRTTPCLLECRPQYGPAQELQPGEIFESFRTFELLHDSWDRERNGLAQRRMYRTIAPWVTENPILMHVRQADDASVKLAIDQCAEVGFEMVIMTFGSGFNLEDESAENLSRLEKLADYAHSKKIALGGYSLLASRKVGGGNDVVMPEGMQPRFGNSPCLESSWGQDYFRKLYQFYEKTEMDILEHDGSYPGDICAASDHPGHDGLADSQWKQFVKIREFYHWCRGKGIYLNVPDWYFLNGSSKTGMGYRENNWSLPRQQQEIIERQNIFDGTWEKTPSMGWMFVPLTEYHGGGAAATIEPLREHLPHYEQRLKNLFGAGVQACYRGPRLFDAPETKAILKKWVDFYKKYRSILDSDIIHLRRPDGRDWDGILHVNPFLPIKGLAVFYNPTDQPLERKINLPLYYTGLTESAKISEQGKNPQVYELNREYQVQVPVRIEARGMTWLVIE